MDADEIFCPPYPTDTTTISRLLDSLGELRGWLLEHRFWANEAYANIGGDGDLIPLPEHLPSIPDESRYRIIAVRDIFSTFMALRSLRKQWDAMTRDFETAWDSTPAIRYRLQMLYSGVMILAQAFVDPETREARQEDFKQEVRKMRNTILKKLGVPKELRKRAGFGMTEDGDFGLGINEGPKEEIDFDALFHGPSEDAEEPQAYHDAEDTDDEDE